jgi:hypothetical protein
MAGPDYPKNWSISTMKQFEVRKNDLSAFRVTEQATPGVEDGEILAEVERFAFTANNISYAVVGEKLGYWNFFPVEEDWGVIPVWGFAKVIESKHPGINEGERLYGYWPMGTHVVMRPGRLRNDQLREMSAHRAELAAVYNTYARISGEVHYDPSMDDERMLLMPLYATSYCLYDFLVANEFFGATQVLVPSASSKTAIGLAYALQDDPHSPTCVGMTSASNLERVAGLGLYDSVMGYADLLAIDSEQPTVIVDMSGNGGMLSDLHRHLGVNMRFTSNVGLTHYDAGQMGPDFIRERSSTFFAPEHIRKRAQERGRGAFQKRAYAFWHSVAIRSRDWLNIEHRYGVDYIQDVFECVRDGEVSPDTGFIVVLS